MPRTRSTRNPPPSTSTTAVITPRAATRSWQMSCWAPCSHHGGSGERFGERTHAVRSSDVRRGAVRVGALLVFVALAGTTYQGVTTAVERREFPRPGRMVDIGDYQLHIACSGKGAPVVVLEAPAA